MNQKTIRAECKNLGISFAAVQETYRKLRDMQRQSVSYEWELRQEVWYRYAPTRLSDEFWRIGLQHKFPVAFAEGDMTMIPRWDECADALNWDAQELFNFIAQPYTTLPSVEQTWKDAIAECVESVDVAIELETEITPF